MTPRRARRAVVAALVATTLLLGLSLGALPGAAAQADIAGSDPNYFAQTGYRIANPALLQFFQTEGGIRTFGYPVSNEFTLLGRRVQIFQRFVLEERGDGSVGVMNLLDDLLPVTHLNGLVFPDADPAMQDAAPRTDSPDYHAQALAFLDEFAPDVWNGLPVGFGEAIRASVQDCGAEAAACGDTERLAQALDIWGLPTSRPTLDPVNPNYVYLRTQRGVLHYAADINTTQGLLLGDWFKTVLTGGTLPRDLAEDLGGSPFLAQYQPGTLLGLARADVLPSTVLLGAFGAEVTAAAAGPSVSLLATPTVLPPGDERAAVSTLGTPPDGLTADTPMTDAPPVTPGSLTPTPTNLPTPEPTWTPSPSPTLVAYMTPTPDPALGEPTPGVGQDICGGDEQIIFVPARPLAGTTVSISVTTHHWHNTSRVKLTGPIAMGSANEVGSTGNWTYEWSFIPNLEATYELTFWADGTRKCASATVVVDPPFGSVPNATVTPTAASLAVPTVPTVPTATSSPTPTPGDNPTSTPTLASAPTSTAVPTSAAPAPTATPTPTAIPPTPTSTPTPPRPTSTPIPPARPSIAGFTPSGGCPGQVVIATGSAFGTGTGGVSIGGHTAGVHTWSNSQVIFAIPSGASGSQPVRITRVDGQSAQATYAAGACAPASS